MSQVRRHIFAFLIGCLWLSSAATAFAFPTYPSLLPNTANAMSEQENMLRPCITCHNNPDGGAGCVGRPLMIAPSNACSTAMEPLLDAAPCLNSFGRMFRDAPLPGMIPKQWTPALAMANADCDQFTNGQELQDPEGTWQFGPPPGNPAYVTRPGFASSNPGTEDRDGDHYCWVGRDLNLDGDCNDPGESTAGLDCNDMAAAVNSGATEVCDDDIDNDCDGRISLQDSECADVADRDGDGYCPTGRDLNGDGDCLDSGESAGAVDCDDTRVTVFPGAAEDCFDTFDNDCDGDVDLADSACDFNDDDGDGFCPVGRDLDGNGSCNDSDAERTATPSDCNDDVATVNPLASEVCTDRVDNDCDQRADFADSDCAHLVDADQDGYCPAGRDLNGNGNCADSDETGGSIEVDCDDDNYRRHPGPEDCTDPLDNDCDMLTDRDDPHCIDFLDHDGDGFCIMGQDLSQPPDDDCMDAEIGETALLSDCDDTNSAVSPAGTEDITKCSDGLDNDCNGVRDARDVNCLVFLDQDRDGYCPQGIDLNRDGDCVDEGEAYAAEDCDDQAANASPALTEHCTDLTPAGAAIDNDCNGLKNLQDPACQGSQLDLDNDGYCPLGIDNNGDGDCNDAGEHTSHSDCNARDPMINPGAEEVTAEACTDARDNDCDGAADLADPDCATFLDQDHDGFCPRGADLDFDYVCLGEGERTAASDCDDTNQLASPRRLEVCDDGIDNDCDGDADYYDSTCHCTMTEQCVPAVTDPCSTYECVGGRCVAELTSECMDAGMEMPDAGMADSGEPDASVIAPPPKSSGCWLSVPGASSALSLWWLWTAGVAFGVRRSRRRRDNASQERQ